MPMSNGGVPDKRVKDEAAAWHMRMMEPVSEAEVAEFEEWLERSPTNAQAYDEIQKLSSLGERLPRRLLFEQSVDRRWRFQPAFGFAAAIVVMLIAGLWLMSPISEPAYAAVSNPGPAIREVRLDDGTEIILDAGTELAVAVADDARRVRITAGRARFTVSLDGERPFSVTAKAATATARRSVFDIAVQGKTASIVVIDGVVDVAASNGETSAPATAIRSGQAVETQGGRLGRSSVVQSETRWPDSRRAFDNTPLATIVRMANRDGDPDIVLRDETIGALEVTGVLDIRNTRALAHKLAATYNLRVEESADAIIITR